MRASCSHASAARAHSPRLASSRVRARHASIAPKSSRRPFAAAVSSSTSSRRFALAAALLERSREQELRRRALRSRAAVVERRQLHAIDVGRVRVVDLAAAARSDRAAYRCRLLWPPRTRATASRVAALASPSRSCAVAAASASASRSISAVSAGPTDLTSGAQLPASASANRRATRPSSPACAEHLGRLRRVAHAPQQERAELGDVRLVAALLRLGDARCSSASSLSSIAAASLIAGTSGCSTLSTKPSAFCTSPRPSHAKQRRAHLQIGGALLRLQLRVGDRAALLLAAAPRRPSSDSASAAMSASNSSTGDSADGDSSEGCESTAPRGGGGGCSTTSRADARRRLQARQPWITRMRGMIVTDVGPLAKRPRKKELMLKF